MMSNIRLIDSQYRLSTSNSNTDFKIEIERVDDARYFKISNLSFYSSQYNVDSRNNQMVFNDGSERTPTLTSGRYSGASLATEIQTQMNTVSSGYTVSYSSVTNKITISHASNFTLNTTNTTSSIYSYLGFSTSADLSGSNSYTGTNSLNLSTKYWYVCIDIANSGQYSLDLPDTVAFIILNDTAWGSMIANKSLTDKVPTNRRSFKFLEITVYDDKKNIIDSNGIDFSFEIEFFNK